jgi:hypothetical protein
LPRSRNGAALISDPRNDSNLALAQLHLAICKFHQFVVHKVGPAFAEDAKRITRRHVQSIVLHDYLRKVVDPEVYADVGANGRRIVYPDPIDHNTPILIPIEFAAACFRVGHSMVRDSYKEWEYFRRDAKLDALLTFTGGGLGFGSLRHLSQEWQINWGAMLGKKDHPECATNRASEIDQFLAKRMYSLPQDLFSESLPKHGILISIAEATLLRQRLHEFQSGQEFARYLNACLPGDHKIKALDADTVLETLICDAPNSELLLKFVIDNGLHLDTPLWLYCLLESRRSAYGKHFGPLTSRIVMETVHAAIEASRDSIICRGRTVNFDARESLSNDSKFLLYDLVEIASAWPA